MGRRTLETNQLFAERYEILKVLGDGGMGTVYLALDNIIREEIALKVMHADYSEDSKHVERFIREVQVSRKIAHPHVVRTYDAGLHDGQLFLTMECVIGESLKEELKRGPLEALDVASILMQVCDGLSAIHATNVVHRDLKPANIIRANDGMIKIADFGIARAEMSQLTGHEEVIGSTAYMAPEIWSGKEIGPPADIYALGISGYELLVGDLPFRASTPAELMWKHLEQPAPAVKDKVPSIPGWLNDLVLILLEKNPEARPCKACEIRDFLSGHLDTDSVALDVSVVHPSPTVLSTQERDFVPVSQDYASPNQPGYHTNEMSADQVYTEELDPYSAPGVSVGVTQSSEYQLEPFVEATGEFSPLATQEMTEDVIASLDQHYGDERTVPRGKRVLSALGNFFFLALVVFILVVPVADFIVVRWKLALASRHAGQLAGYSLGIFLYYSILLSSPVFLLGILKGLRRPKSVWWKMAVVNLGILFSFLMFSVIALDSKLEGASKLLQVVAYSSAIEPAVAKMIQVSLLHPYASVFEVVNQNGIVQVSRSVGKSTSPLDWYYAVMFAFLFACLTLLRRRKTKESSRLLRSIALLVGMALVISVERMLVPVFVKPSAIGIVEKLSPKFGVFFPVFDWYSVGCGIVNWSFLFLIVIVVPWFQNWYRKR